MAAKLLNFATALAVLSACALVYHLTVVRWLEPPEVELAEITHVRQTAGPTRVEEMFAEGSWQRTARKRLTIKDQGYVLFSERKQITPSQWRVWPVTVVMQRDGKPSVILDAPEGADVTFAEALDVLGSEAPPIKGGQLVGKVTIRSIAPQPGQTLELRDQLEIQAQDVGIDNRRIWTNEAISLRWGGSVLAGRNLTIRLAGGGTIPTSGGQSPLAILDSMELVYLDRLEFPVPARGRMHPRGGAALPDENTLPAGQKVPDGRASIQCKGRVTFDFATDRLQLRDSVRLEHQPHLGPADTIECDWVCLEFNNPLARDLPRETADDWLRSIEAKGQPVVIKLPTVAGEAVAESIRYDAEAGALYVKGSAGVRLAYQGVNLQTSDFVYQFPAEDPTRIGTLECAGSGFLDFQNSDELAIKTLRWSNGVRLQPLAEAGLHEVWIDGKVTTTLSDGGKILADALRFTFRQLPQSAEASPATAQAAREPKRASPFRPEQASATGNVVFDTALMYAETELLQLFFQVQSEPPPPPEPSLALNPASGPTKRFWVRQPDARDDTVAPVARPRPTLSADSVSANIALFGREVVGSDLSVVGDVRLKHRMVTPQAVLPVTAAGEKLRIISKNGHDMIQIDGGPQPAKFEMGDGFFIGPLIRVSTSDNYVWIDRSGHLQMPSAVLPAGQGRNPAAIQWLSPPSCKWAGEMFFDGRTVKLSGGVHLAADLKAGQDQTPWKLAATGEHMQIALDEPVRIQDPDAMRAAAVQKISLVGSDTQGVFVTADQTDAAGRLQARHVLSAPTLDILPQVGRLEGPGPGWYRQWAVAQPDGPFAGFVPAGGLMGTHLVFADSLQGDLNNKELKFQRGVRIGVRPVASWNEVFDAANMDSLAEGQATIDCQTLRFAQAPLPPQAARPTPAYGGPAYGASLASPTSALDAGAWEIEAAGGVAFRVRNERGLFETTGNRASYAAAKDLFIIEGDGRQPARIQQTQPDGTKGPGLAFGIITVRPKTMEIDGQLHSGSSGMLPASMRKRRP
ncbi:hypothetical protein [Roseimaritima ulvae]|uniref:OstA-like protein n=1 Tax=Roseimaritima ulvae TaxID=980254 RepID=A0A5B9QT92_9BACT|nr:hypothetical protein [Roseimaritima ulvae]QEG42228.1 hypothetical protein UC8_42620 [Roseimaritima ulvae]